MQAKTETEYDAYRHLPSAQSSARTYAFVVARDGREGGAGHGPGTDAFIGRAWLADAVREWAASGARHLLITGGPGTGKSAAVDHLWGDRTGCAAVHRCRANDRRACDPVRFAESLAEQLSVFLPGFADALLQVSDMPGLLWPRIL